MTQYELVRLVIREMSGSLSPTQKTVLLHLMDRANRYGQCWPSQSRLSKQTGFSVRAVRKSISDLTAAGLITLVSSGKGRTHSNTYSINVDAITQLSEQGSHSDEETGAESHPSGKEIGNEVPHLDRKTEEKEGKFFPALGHEDPLLRHEDPLLRHEVPLTKAGSAHKEIQEERQEEIHEAESSAQQKEVNLVTEPFNSVNRSGYENRFMLPPDWVPNNHLLMEQAKERNLEGVINLNQHYKREILNKFKNQYTGKKGVFKTSEEWHQTFCKTIELQLRIDGVEV